MEDPICVLVQCLMKCPGWIGICMMLVTGQSEAMYDDYSKALMYANEF